MVRAQFIVDSKHIRRRVVSYSGMVEPSGVARGCGGKEADEECELNQALGASELSRGRVRGPPGPPGPRRTTAGPTERLELARALALLRFGHTEQDGSKDHSRASTATRTSAAAIAIFDRDIAEKVAKACVEQATLHDAVEQATLAAQGEELHDDHECLHRTLIASVRRLAGDPMLEIVAIEESGTRAGVEPTVSSMCQSTHGANGPQSAIVRGRAVLKDKWGDRRLLVSHTIAEADKYKIKKNEAKIHKQQLTHAELLVLGIIMNEMMEGANGSIFISCSREACSSCMTALPQIAVMTGMTIFLTAPNGCWEWKTQVFVPHKKVEEMIRG